MNLTESNNDWPLPVAEPEEVGFSADRLARIRPAIQKYVDEQKVPCMITLVARHGRIAYFDAVGYMDIESKQPVRKDAFFRLWSNTKPITGVATMILVEDGLLNLDDPISKYIPAFKNPRVRNLNPAGTEETTRTNPIMPTVPARREITVRDCLRNTTGLPTVNRVPLQEISQNRNVLVKARLLSGPVEARASSIQEMIENLAQLPLSAHPGTEFEYQVGYPVAGIVIEIVTGKTLDEFYRERIFEPLKMKDSSFYLSEEQIERFTTSYRMQQEGKNWGLVVVDRPETSEKIKGPKNWSCAGGDHGGVVTTIADYARFAQMLLNGGELDGVRILGRKTVELMTSNHTGHIFLPMRGPGWGFGIGVGVRTDTNVTPLLQSAGSYGWGGAAGTGYFSDPKEDLFVIYFTQVMDRQMIPGGSYSEDIERLVYQSLI